MVWIHSEYWYMVCLIDEPIKLSHKTVGTNICGHDDYLMMELL